MTHILFEVITQKPIDITFSLKTHQRFPTHEMYLIEGEKKLIICKYNPTSKFNKEEFITYMLGYLKQRFNAYSVTYGELEKQIEK